MGYRWRECGGGRNMGYRWRESVTQLVGVAVEGMCVAKSEERKLKQLEGMCFAKSEKSGGGSVRREVRTLKHPIAKMACHLNHNQCHHLSSPVITCHHMSSHVITITCHHMSSHQRQAGATSGRGQPELF